MAFVLSRYKFAARLACEGRRVLELGCSEGLGAPILSEAATCYVGVDLDAEAVAHAEANFADQGRSFLHADLLGQRFGTFDAVISMDVVEHIDPGYEDLFFRCVFENLGEDGIAVIGTPNVTAEAYASEASRQGHVNLMDAERLTAALGRVSPQCLHFFHERRSGAYRFSAHGPLSAGSGSLQAKGDGLMPDVPEQQGPLA